MSEKRRDKRNRILHNGETQRPDGRYRFKYTDSDGKERCIYSWRLEHNDPHPKDKRKDLSLREKEKQIEQDCLIRLYQTAATIRCCHWWKNMFP